MAEPKTRSTTASVHDVIDSLDTELEKLIVHSVNHARLTESKTPAPGPRKRTSAAQKV